MTYVQNILRLSDSCFFQIMIYMLSPINLGPFTFIQKEKKNVHLQILFLC